MTFIDAMVHLACHSLPIKVWAVITARIPVHSSASLSRVSVDRLHNQGSVSASGWAL